MIEDFREMASGDGAGDRGTCQPAWATVGLMTQVVIDACMSVSDLKTTTLSVML
jgi:hypothetical protein